MENSKLILDIQDLVVEYHTEDGIVHAVNGVNIQIEPKKTLGLVGETGAGKTTTAMSILRLVPDPPGIIKSGKIFLGGKDIFSLPVREMRALRGRFASMIFQDPMTSLNPVMPVADQIAEVIKLHEKVGAIDAMEKALEMLDTVGIARDRASNYAHQLSGGMRQRIVIAIALACSPKLLIADEPTTALDVTIQAQILEVMRDLRNKFNTAMIMITHDLGIVAEICDDVSVMYAGKIVEHGALEEVFKQTRHPYTEGLFNSLPNINYRSSKLKPIPGLMPDPTELSPGCTFAPRCDYAIEKCFTEAPSIQKFSDTHYALCTRYEDPAFCVKGRVSAW